VSAPASGSPLDLQVRIPCPQCGAAGEWSLLQTLHQCPYCTSVLWRPQDPARQESYRVLDLAPRREDCLDVLQTTDAMREQARIRGMADTDNAGEGPAMGPLLADVLTPEIETLKRRRAGLFRVRDFRTVHAPYLMIYDLLAYHALGRTKRSGAERKVFRPFLFSLDAVLPAYPESWNFRDRGLWFSRQSLLPLEEESLASGEFMRPRDMEELGAGPGRAWLGRRKLLEADLDPTFFTARIVRTRRWWIFRPFHCVLADTPMGSGWFLVDGQFRTLAGHLDELEAARVLTRDWPPLDLERFLRPQVRPFPCRCPVCAGTLELDERGVQQICPNCGRLLEPTPDGFKARPYRLLDRSARPWKAPEGAERTAWVPFWRLSGEWRLGSETFPSPEHLAARILPPARRAAPPPAARGPLHFPAFEGWLYDRYDEWCFSTAAALGSRPEEPAEGRFHLQENIGAEDLVISPSLDAEIYETQLGALVPSLLTPATQVRLNPVAVKQLQEARFTVTGRDLVFVPVPLGRFGDMPDRLMGPAGAVDAAPLATGAFPPVLYRNVQRWKDRAEPPEAPWDSDRYTTPEGRILLI
jgi:predicted RNA-binding Zn-ribbon protein involved in translation (DUF1610 family)